MKSGDDQYRCEVTGGTHGGVGTNGTDRAKRHTKSKLRLEGPPPSRDQVIAGVPLLAEARLAYLYKPGERPEIRDVEQSLDDAELLPGFSAPLSAILSN